MQSLYKLYERLSRDAQPATTLYSLVGSVIGVVDGLIIGTAFGWSDVATLIFSTILGLLFGGGLSLLSLVRQSNRMEKGETRSFVGNALPIIVTTLAMGLVAWVMPGALKADITDGLFWGSIALGAIVGCGATILLIRLRNSIK